MYFVVRKRTFCTIFFLKWTFCSSLIFRKRTFCSSLIFKNRTFFAQFFLKSGLFAQFFSPYGNLHVFDGLKVDLLLVVFLENGFFTRHFS